MPTYLALVMVVVAASCVLPYAGARGRARLTDRDGESLRATHEQLALSGVADMAVGYAVIALLFCLVEGRFAEAIAQTGGLVVAVLCLRAHPGALRNATDELDRRGLSPKPQPPRSVRRRRRTRQIGMGSLALFGLGSFLLWLLPEGSALVFVAGALLVLALCGVLALAVAGAWVYGDEETDEPTRRT